MQRMTKTSVEIPEELYQAFKRMGGATLGLLVRDAMREYIGIKGASEDALAVLQLKHDRLIEEKIHYEKKLQYVDSELKDVIVRIEQVRVNVVEKDRYNQLARIMNEEVNPIIRALNFKVTSITPELHNVLLKLSELGVDHNLESMVKHAAKLEQSDWLLGGFRDDQKD